MEIFNEIKSTMIWKILTFVFIACTVVLSVVAYNLSIEGPKNQTGISIVNNCDTIYQVINLSNPNFSFSNTTNQKRKSGVGLNVGYSYSFLHNSGGLEYGLNYRYNNFTFGGVYNPNFNAYGFKVGLVF